MRCECSDGTTRRWRRRSAPWRSRRSSATRAVVVARIRLGEALRCADEFERAEAELRTALAAGRAQPGLGLTDFALQHLGKTLLDAGRADEAEPLLAEALALRRERGDAAPVESTRLAVERARAETAK